MTHATPDASAPAETSPDAHGQAALLLVESLIHGLIERGVLDVEAAIDLVETASSVGEDIRDASRASGERTSLDLLQDIAASLSTDLP